MLSILAIPLLTIDDIGEVRHDDYLFDPGIDGKVEPFEGLLFFKGCLMVCSGRTSSPHREK